MEFIFKNPFFNNDNKFLLNGYYKRISQLSVKEIYDNFNKFSTARRFYFVPEDQKTVKTPPKSFPLVSLSILQPSFSPEGGSCIASGCFSASMAFQK